jgi:hypothetical protein
VITGLPADLLGIQPDRQRPVVDQSDLHLRPEAPDRHRQAKRPRSVRKRSTSGAAIAASGAGFPIFARRPDATPPDVAALRQALLAVMVALGGAAFAAAHAVGQALPLERAIAEALSIVDFPRA